METQKLELKKKKKNFKIFKIEFYPYPECPYPMHEKKSPWLRRYQSYSYIRNWYINGKVFTSTTAWKLKNLIFFSKKFKI